MSRHFIKSIEYHLPEVLQYKLHNPDAEFFFYVIIILFVVVLVVGFIFWKMAIKVKEKIPEPVRAALHRQVSTIKEFVVPTSGPRFRKRDKISFMGQKLVKRVKAAGNYVKGGQYMQGRKRRAIAKFAKRWLGGHQISPETIGLKFRSPMPLEYLEEDNNLGGHGVLPEQLKFVLQNMRVFGHFEQPIFLELLNKIEYISVPANQFLFRVGDPDENIFIVQSGKLNVYANEPNEAIQSLKHVKPGDSIMSLLSFLDHLSGKAKPYRTVSAKALADTKVIKLPFSAFKLAFEKYPDAYLRVVQVVMIRLQRVTLLALHQYLGLGTELISTKHRGFKPQKISPEDTEDDAENLDAKKDNLESTRLTDPDLEQELSKSPPSALQIQMSQAGNPLNSSQKNRRASEDKREQLMRFALNTYQDQLGLESEATLEGKVELRDIPDGYRIMEEDSLKDAALVLVVQGCFTVSQKLDGKEQEVHLCYPGGLLGQLQVLTGEPSFFTVQARQSSKVATLSRQVVYDIMSKQPDVTLHLARSVIDHMSQFVRSIDFALDWVLIDSGKALYHQGDESDSTYVVLSGRLRSVKENKNGNKEMVAEYGRGELCGIIEMLMEVPRSTTLMAVRDTEIAKLPAGLINAIKLKHPVVVSRLINLLGKRLLSLQMPSQMNQPQIAGDDTKSSFTTVAVIGITSDVPLSAFTYELTNCLKTIGAALRISPDVVKVNLGPTALEQGNEYKLTSWLGSQEDQHRMVVYECDPVEKLTPWTQVSIRHADCILLLARADQSPAISQFEEKLETMSLRTTKELVLLHTEETLLPKGTAKWLENRSWISGHHHMKIPNKMFAKRSERKISDHYQRLTGSGVKPDIHSDFSRLARTLTGTSVGLVLGGGGARGCSHVGMIKAILEAGIPIDRVAGVSIGALMGGAWCMERDIREMTIKARNFCMKMSEKWRLVIELTYPTVSLFTGFGFNGLIEEVFGDCQIEDLWLPYFTITTDISVSSMRIHESGSLWRYVRSSMSLASYMPPLCDPVDGHLLLDGGYVNNLPADIMHKKGAKHILAVDVGSQDDSDLENYGDWLSGWHLLWRRWNPFAGPIKIPSQADIQIRLAYVSCTRLLEEVKNSTYCDYIRPPIDKYATLQFDAFDEIRDVGYYHGQTYFAGLRKAGQLGWINSEKSHSRRGSLEDLGTIQSPLKTACGNYARFTDLAEVVCRVRQSTPDRQFAMEDSLEMLDTDSNEDDEFNDDDSDLITDPEDYYLDEDMESGFISHPGHDDTQPLGISMSSHGLVDTGGGSTPMSRSSSNSGRGSGPPAASSTSGRGSGGGPPARSKNSIAGGRATRNSSLPSHKGSGSGQAEDQ